MALAKGWTDLHTAARSGDVDAVRSLLASGADPNAREDGDNTYPLHWAAANRHLDIVRMLLDAGGDPHGLGDVHQLDAIGWATFYHPDGGQPGDQPEIASLLVERGARHHVISAISLGDPNLIRRLVADDPSSIDRRLSRFEGGLTALQLAEKLKRPAIYDLLLELGAKAPPKIDPSEFAARIPTAAAAIRKCVPMIYVPDVALALEWYVSIGFKELARYEDDGVVNFGMVSMGGAELMLNMHGKAGSQTASLWFYTSDVDELYALLKSQPVEFVEEINDTFYGVRQFGTRDLNGYVLYFEQPLNH